MSRKPTRNTSRAGRREVDWHEIDALTDEDIETAVSRDPDAAPVLGQRWFEEAALVIPGRKRPISFRVDSDVLEYFMAGGPGYQTRMNAVLRQYVEHQKKRALLSAFFDQSRAGPKAPGPVHPPAGRAVREGNVHTIRNAAGTGWVNTVGGRVVSHHRTQEDAADRGRRIAIKTGSEHVIHARDGRVREKISYGNDPVPRRTKR